jgi:hypothetical protein
MTNSVTKRLLKLKFRLFTEHVSHMLDREPALAQLYTNCGWGESSFFAEYRLVLTPFEVSFSLPKRSAKVSA